MQVLSLLAIDFAKLFDSWFAVLLLVVCVLLFAAIIVLIVFLTIRYKVVFVISETENETRSFYKNNVLEQFVPVREGYRFLGWYSDAEGTQKVADKLRVTQKDMVLYAKWEPLAQDAQILAERNEATTEKFAEAAEITSVDELTEETKTEETPVAETTEEVVAEESVVESAAEESVAEEVAEEEEEEDENTEVDEGDEIDNALVTTVTGAKVFVQYRRSFRARLIQADGEVKDFYNSVRNALLSVRGVKERISWPFNSFNKGRKKFAKVNANRKSLIVYLALNPDTIEEKYTYKNVAAKKRYADVPVRLKITGSRSLSHALQLIERAVQENEYLHTLAPFEEKLSIPYEERDPLIKRGLIKVYAKKETGETITNEQLEEFIEEGATVESLSSYTVTDRVSVTEAEKLVSDATAKQLMALADEVADHSPRVSQAKRALVNLDTICANYADGETVSLKTLQAKKLVNAKMGAVKILGRGSLDKALIVEAADFSLSAVKMIVLTGGKVIRLKKV